MAQSAQLKFLNTQSKPQAGNPVLNYLFNLQNSVNQSVNDVGQFTKETGEGWGQALSSIIPTLQGKKIKPIKDLSPSAQRGQDIMAGILMGGPQTGAEGAAPNDVSAIANEAKAGAQNVANDVTDIVKTSQAQPGGLQAGFLRIGNDTPKSPVRVVLDPGIYGAGKEQTVQQTVDSVVPGATATEKYANLEPTMQKLGDQIQGSMIDNPKSATLDDIMQNYDQHLNDQGIYRNSDVQGGLRMKRDAVQKLASQYITDLYNSARGETNDVIPSQISDQGLYNLRRSISQDLKSVYRKIDNGTSLTDQDRVKLAAMNAVDDTLSGLHPEIKDLITTQSHLYDATDSLFKGREAEIKAAQKTEEASGKGLLNKLLYQVKENPVGAATLGAIVAPAVYSGARTAGQTLVPGLELGANKLLDYFNKSNQTQEQPASKSDNRTYSIPDPIQSKIIMNPNDYVQQKSALQKELAYEKQYGLPMAGITQGKMDALDTQYEQQKQLRDTWSNANNTGISQQIHIANQAAKAISQADPSFFNALQGGYDSLQKASNGKYAYMAQALQYLSKQTGTDFTGATSKEALLKQIDSAVDAIKGNWNSQLQSFYGASSVDQGGIPQGPAGKRNNTQSTQQASPPTNSGAMPPGFNFGSQM